MFFGLMSAVLVGVKYKSDKRDQYLHHGGWLVKLALWMAFCILPFFFPVGLVNAYCKFVPCCCAVYMGSSESFNHLQLCLIHNAWIQWQMYRLPKLIRSMLVCVLCMCLPAMQSVDTHQSMLGMQLGLQDLALGCSW